ncbi:PH domain-containing protein [Mammaliicoccus vitulinus]|uniref:PH domain-containing protein n=1 Tax=Mammaliicoccus vitulinus TaxID=71237 RepID=A0ABX7HCK6_9STAP|nr:PH domain-containing protein [Mammaliicoccus vitulinus]MBM6629876.1 PH domain-containing protein [Mammaliicoccus vitulinus]MBO3077958.1 PH domain-containing protein [Mammaliicoccus vitulinus]MEB7658264.1 PH domain-containing protein [Mammaliicoccus vitulinus]PNZ38414.1 PH domain-containing protein [Mammaliicoccus vitulinus]QJF25549.1 PH domain-containing protein [Mammaliicoccus vitulinus]
MAVQDILSWTLFEQVAVPDNINQYLVESEQAYSAFKTYRDTAVFTNKRIIIRDMQGITGKKVETYSIPYNIILMWSTENAGKLLDLNGEITLWTRAGNFKIKIGRNLDIMPFEKLLSNALL